MGGRFSRISLCGTFLSCLLVVIFFALSPNPLDLPSSTNDKLQHVVAFATLSALGALAWPSSLLLVSGSLLLLGGFIELLQGSTLIGRDMSLNDWFADGIGVCVGAVSARALRLLRSQ